MENCPCCEKRPLKFSKICFRKFLKSQKCGHIYNILDLVQNSTDNLFINICLLLYNSPLDTNKGDNIIYKDYDVKKNNRS